MDAWCHAATAGKGSGCSDPRKTTSREDGIEPRLVESYGKVAETIEKLAAAGHFDAIVVGSRGLSMLDRALQGSVSEHIAANAGTTVIVAR